MTREERSWVLYDWANSAYALTIMTAVLPVFYKEVAARDLAPHLSTAAWGYANTAASLAVALLAPVLGTIADYRSYKKRFFAVFFALGVAATAALATVGPGEWRWCLAVYIVSVIGFAGANVFYDAFLVDVATRERMDWISSCGYAWGYFGSTLPFMASLAFVLWNRRSAVLSSAGAVQAAFLVTAAWWAVFTIPFFRHVRQRYAIEPSPQPVRDGLRRLAATFAEVRRHREAFVFLVAYFFYIDGVDTIIRMAVVYGEDLGIGQSELLKIILAVQFVAFPFALLAGKLAERVPAKHLLLAGVAVYIGITLYACWLTTVGQFWVLALLVGTSQGGVQALSRSLFGRLIPPDRSAEFFGFYNIFGKFAAILGPLLVGLGTHVFRTSRFGILGLIVLFVAGGVVLLRVRPAEAVPARV